MPNAIEMLREDHRKVKDLFENFEQSEGSSKEQICQQAIVELETHAALEEEIFYPAAEELIDEKELIDEAMEEHHVVKLVMAELKKMSADDERFDAKFKVMAESVKHHIEEEESELFPQLKGKLDEQGLGEEMQTRKEELQQKSSRRSASASKGARSRTRSTTKRAKKQRSGKKARKASGGRR
jgi:hemerythrin superfamily protein